MKIKSILLAFILSLGVSMSANAFWGNNGWGNGWGNNGWGNNGWGSGWGNGWNPYSVWDPRYWFEEMEDAFDDDWGYGGYGYPYGGGGRGYPYGGGGRGYPYGGGYGFPQYGGGYGFPQYGGGYGFPYAGGLGIPYGNYDYKLNNETLNSDNAPNFPSYKPNPYIPSAYSYPGYRY